MKANDELFERLLIIVPKGKQNAIPQSFLASLLNLTPSQLKSLVLSARTNGYFISGDTNGYYIPETLSELHTYYRYMYDGAMTRLHSLKKLRETLKMFGVDPEKDYPDEMNESIEVPSKNVSEPSETKKKFQQSCFVFFPEDWE